MEIQVLENEDRIKQLEREMDALTKELCTPPRAPRVHRSKGEDRPTWFGDAFWIPFQHTTGYFLTYITESW